MPGWGGWSRALATNGRAGAGGAGGPGRELFLQRVGWVAAHLGEEGQVTALGKAAALRGGN